MLKRLPYLMLMLFLATFLAMLAPLRASPPIGAVIQTWRYDAQQQTITLRVVNTSHKDITAYSITLTEKFADGTTHTSERSTDLLELALGGGGGFPAGTSRDEILPETNPVTDVVATLDVVAYSDGTADVLNQRAFKNLVGMRKANAAAAQKISDVATQAPTVEAAKAELSRLTVLLNAKNHTAHSDEETWEDAALQTRLQEATSALGHTDLKTMGKKYGELATAIGPHTRLVQRKEAQ